MRKLLCNTFILFLSRLPSLPGLHRLHGLLGLPRLHRLLGLLRFSGVDIEHLSSRVQDSWNQWEQNQEDYWEQKHTQNGQDRQGHEQRQLNSCNDHDV